MTGHNRLVQLGMVVAVSFSSTLLPTLTDALQKNQLARFRQIAKLLMRISATIAAAATVGMIVLDAGNQYVAFQYPYTFANDCRLRVKCLRDHVDQYL